MPIRLSSLISPHLTSHQFLHRYKHLHRKVVRFGWLLLGILPTKPNAEAPFSIANLASSTLLIQQTLTLGFKLTVPIFSKDISIFLIWEIFVVFNYLSEENQLSY